MKKLLSMLFALLMCVSVATPISATYRAAEDEETNWVQENETWYVLDEAGNKMTGWYRDAKLCWYYLDYTTGAMKTGWAADGKDANGNVKWYYFGDNGIMKTGWQNIGGSRYYFYDSGDEAGLMAIGTVEIDGLRYNFSNTGELIGQSNKGEPIYSGHIELDEMVSEILSEIIKPEMSEEEEIKAIHDWICNYLSYGGITISNGYRHEFDEDFDESIQVDINRTKEHMDYHHAYDALIDKHGVCNDYVDVFNILADALGYKTSSVSGRYTGNGHIVSVIWWNNEWKIIDVQADDYKGDGTISYFGFLVSPEDYTNFEPVSYFDFKNPENDLIQNIRYYFEQYQEYGWGNTVEEIAEYLLNNFCLNK